jgi:diacylglycerol kinase family enzyme
VDEVDVVAVAGGDGTINEVLNGLRAPAPTLAIIPLGTANVLAIEIGLSLRPSEIARAIVHAPARPICLGNANGRRFVMMLGIGFDAEVVRRVGPRLKLIAGRGAYVGQSLLAALSFPRRRYAVSIDGNGYEAASLVVANGHAYAGRFTCAPQARLDRPALEICLFHDGGPRAALGYMAALASGRLDRLASVEVVRGTRIRVAGRSGEPVQADGDIALALPLEIGIDPLRVPLVGGPKPG